MENVGNIWSWGREGSRLEFKRNSRDRSDTRYGFTLYLVLQSIFILLRKSKLSTSKSISSVGNGKRISDSINPRFSYAKWNRFLFVLDLIHMRKVVLKLNAVASLGNDANLSFLQTWNESWRMFVEYTTFLLIGRPLCPYRSREICRQFLEFEIGAWVEGKASRYPERVGTVRLIWIIG